MTSARADVAVVLAAGKGTRMVSDLPKVLHGFAGRTLLGHVLAAVDAPRVAVVVGHGKDLVEATLPIDVVVAHQEQQRGTGHAVSVALDSLTELAEDAVVLVISGDTPLITRATLDSLVLTHRRSGAVATVLTAVVGDPTGYGRIVREADGSVAAIVEHREASASVLAIKEINTGIYAFTAGPLRKALSLVGEDNSQGEQYLTDVIAISKAQHLVVSAQLGDAAETAGVNDRAQLSAAALVFNARRVQEAMVAGVTIVEPATTWLDVDVALEADVTLHPGTRLYGSTTVAAGAAVGPDTTLTDTTVGAGARIRSSTCEGATVGENATVGPYSYLRPGAVLGAGAKVGAFVEIKKSSIGVGSKVPHLSYIGDATVGDRVNLGAGTITSNYDGVDKHHTTIGDDVFTGSSTILVPPLTLHDSAYTASGSVITEDVPAGALGIGRARQVIKDGWVKRKRQKPRDIQERLSSDQQHSPGQQQEPDALQREGLPRPRTGGCLRA